jgi:hypothetical protein
VDVVEALDVVGLGLGATVVAVVVVVSTTTTGGAAVVVVVWRGRFGAVGPGAYPRPSGGLLMSGGSAAFGLGALVGRGPLSVRTLGRDVVVAGVVCVVVAGAWVVVVVGASVVVVVGASVVVVGATLVVVVGSSVVVVVGASVLVVVSPHSARAIAGVSTIATAAVDNRIAVRRQAPAGGAAFRMIGSSSLNAPGRASGAS